ncbi:cation:proton antiporter [Halomonas urumqiensis]|uniref:Sodium:proton antiporter n=1 Tax=Halomonas urumqiensis TaxID=1684789 RepID=A0A2N7UFT0_9GAMM|nr:cation:proton antiporter [Halomonas urumqiensis]PMR79309.1 sodium:proton antiporter [Halomonas urumqiensis]PTB03983.1 sodium:proton antiporter [Halomonas urumqiensis]GHE19759.1 sodium:proton antiporter [Halomonas urumqiensis]
MTTATWFILIGSLLLIVGFTFSYIRRVPATSAIVYLLIGSIVGPMGFALFHFNPLEESALLELLTEIAVLISLYCAGVKMPAPVTFKRWRNPLQLAVVSMSLTVGLVALFGYYWLALPLGAAVLLGAVVAPTDPVLATEVQVRHADDSDELRFALTCEAGMNDGSAFPFVMLGLGLLGLHDLGDAGWRWLAVDVLWASGAGIGIGILAGMGVGWLVERIRAHFSTVTFLESFLGLGLIAFAYGISLLVDAWGFLAVFSAAVALRHTELKLAGLKQDYSAPVEPGQEGKPLPLADLHISESSLVFNEHLERLSEIVLVLLIGGSLFWDSWSWRAVGFAAFVFFVARPVSVHLGLLGTRSPMRLRNLAGWFGVRGIGSLYYLMYAIQHGLPEEIALELIHLTLAVVALSIVVHGVSVKPAIDRFWRSRRQG